MPIPGYEGHYEVSNLAGVRSLKRAEPYLLVQTICNAGYRMVPLSLKGKQQTISVHRLVAMTFIGPPPASYCDVNHIDGDKLNNLPSNLEYCTRSQNVRLGMALRPPKARTRSPQKRPDGEVEAIYKLANDGLSYKAIAMKLGISKDRVCSVFKVPVCRRGTITLGVIQEAFGMADAGFGIADITLKLGIPMDILRYLKLTPIQHSP